jgi:hypothetical protein
MTPALIEHYREVIARAPGPAPWYLGQVGSDLSVPLAKLTWERDSRAGPTELIDDKRRVYALASMYSYVRRISSTQFVVWYKSGTPEVGRVTFQLYEVLSLRPMTDKEASLARLKRTPFGAAATLLAEYSIPRNQPIGLQKMQFPPDFTACPELFVLVSNDNTWENVGLNLWSIDPSNQQMKVSSQDWFTRGPYDFGYQWVTRVARSPETGNLIGDGIRIGAFVLNEDGSKFLEWVGAEHFPNKDMSIGSNQ